MRGQRCRVGRAIHHLRVRQPERTHHRAGAERREQPVVRGAAADEQVADHVALAVERGVEVRRVRRRRVRADGQPAAAAVVVGVARVAGAAGVGGPVAVGVEVQIVLQLVAGAVVVVGVGGAGGAAHVGAVVAERLAPARGVAGGRSAVAVQIPAHGVQLGEGADLDQAVVVVVVVAALEHRVGAAVAQRRVVRAGAEVPGGLAGIVVVVHVHVRPGGVDAGGAGGGSQLARGAAGALGGSRDAAGGRVPVAGGGRAGAVRQAVLVRRRAAAGDRAGRVAGFDGSGVEGRQAAGVPADVRAAGHGRLRVAGDDDGAGLHRAHQAADVGVAGRRAGRPDGLDAAAQHAGQRRHAAAAVRHVGVRQAEGAHHGARAQRGEEAGPVAAAAGVQVVDVVAVAVEDGVEGFLVDAAHALGEADGDARADGVPAVAGVVVGVVGIAGAGRVGGPVAVGVEVQILGELVALADGGGAAHAGGGVGEGAAGAGVVRDVAGREAVAVQIPSDGVELGQGGDFDQAVFVGVVVRAGALVVGHAHAQARGGAVVAAAGGGVGEGGGFVEGVRRVLLGGDGDRLRRVPVRRGEGEGGLVHRCGGVVAGHRDRDVGGGGGRQGHGVGGGGALGEQEGAWVLGRGGRVRVDQHRAAVVVRDRDLDGGAVAFDGHSVGERGALVLGVVVRVRGHRHGAAGVPVGGVEGEGVLVAGGDAVRVHADVAGGAADRHRRFLGEGGADGDGVGAAVGVGGTRVLVQPQRGGVDGQVERLQHRRRRRGHGAGLRMRRRGHGDRQGAGGVEVRIAVGQREGGGGVALGHRGGQGGDGEAGDVRVQSEAGARDAADEGGVGQRYRHRGAAEVVFAEGGRGGGGDVRARGVGAVHLVGRVVREREGAEGEDGVGGAVRHVDGAAVQGEGAVFDGDAVRIAVRRHDRVAEAQRCGAGAGGVAGLAGVGADAERQLGGAGDVHGLVEGEGGLDGLAEVVGVAQRRGVEREGEDAGRAEAAVDLVLRGVGEGAAAQAEVRSHRGVAGVVDGAAVQRQGVPEDADAVEVQVAGLHQVAEAQPRRANVPEELHLAGCVADGQRQARRAGHRYLAVVVDGHVDPFVVLVGVVAGGGAAEVHLVHSRHRELGAVHLVVAVVRDGVRAEAEDGVPGALPQPDGAAVQGQRGRRDADAVGVHVRLHQLVAEHQRVGAGAGGVAGLAGVRADHEGELGRADDVHHAVERDRRLDGFAALVGAAEHRRVERHGFH